MTTCDRLSADPALQLLAQTVQDIELDNEHFYIEAGNESGRLYVEIVCYRPDVVTGLWGYGHGGRRYLPYLASKDTIVKTVFGAYLAYVEHEARETFLYKGKRVFGPHIAVDALATVADQIT